MPASNSKDVVLVTGGAGYIGSHVLLALQDAGIESAALDDLSVGSIDVVPNGVPFYAGDIADDVLISRIIKDHGITAVMHMAARSFVEESVSDPLRYYQNNVSGSIALIQSCVAGGIEKFVFASSASVYGQPSQSPVAETAALLPCSPYGQSKLIVEQILQDVQKTYAMEVSVLRCFNAAGVDAAGRTGAHHCAGGHVMRAALRAAQNPACVLTIFGADFDTADGSCVRDYIHVSDVAEIFLSCLNLERPAPGQPLIINCGTSIGTSVLQVLHAIERLSGKLVQYQLGERRPGDCPAVVADIQRLQAMLRWSRPLRTLDEMIQSTIDSSNQAGAASQKPANLVGHASQKQQID